MSRRSLFVLASAAMAMAAWAAPMRGQSTPAYEYRILKVENTQPGQYPVVTFQVIDPSTGAPHSITSDDAWKQTKTGASRLFVQIGWDTRDYTNTASGTAPALPIAINALTASAENLDLTYTVTSTVAIPSTARGTGTAALEGHPAGKDAAGAWTVRVPVRSAYYYFPITDATPVARREVVDIDKCKACHGQLSLHGFNRTDEVRVCVMCHNANTTDITQRRFGDGPEVPIDFKNMVHAIHAAEMRTTPYSVIGFNHVTHDFSKVDFPGELANCETCHRSGTYGLPLGRNVLGTTVNTGSSVTETAKIVDADPANDLNITPIAAACSACHDSQSARDHMRSRGASFSALQTDIDSGRVGERCPKCHGPGRAKDVVRVHAEEANDR